MGPQSQSKVGLSISKAAAVKFVILLAVVSLFADATYEGARSVLRGVLYDVSLPALIAFLVATHLASIPLFFWAGKRAVR